MFSIRIVLTCISPDSASRFSFLDTISIYLIFFIIAILTGVRLLQIAILTGVRWYLIIHSLVICVSSLEKGLFRSLHTGLFGFYWVWVLYDFLVHFGDYLTGYLFTKISPILQVAFSLLMVSVVEQKHLVWCNPKLYIAFTSDIK